MSGHSGSDICPNCGEQMAVYDDYKPFPHSTCDCQYCGFFSQVVTGLRCKQDLLRDNFYEPVTDAEIKKLGLYKNALDGNTAVYKKREAEVRDCSF